MRLLVYYATGITLETMFYGGMMLFISVSFEGSYVGKIVVNHISQTYFNTIVSLFLWAIGLRLFLVPWVG